MKFKRAWHPYWKWEEIAHGMWSEVDDRSGYLHEAIAFTGDHEQYGEYMMRVVKEWPISTENALTDNALNQRAWVGHAACALAFGCPEDIVREAWGKLTDEQRLLANKAAEHAIGWWKNNYAQDRNLHPNMGGTLL